MNTNSTVLISFLGTEPSFKKDMPSFDTSQNKMFLKDLTQSLKAMKSFSFLLNNFENELKVISKNSKYSDKLEDTIAVIAEDMNMTMDGQSVNMTLEDRIENKNKNLKNETTLNPSIRKIPTFKPTL